MQLLRGVTLDATDKRLAQDAVYKMPSLKSLRRSPRGFAGDVREAGAEVRKDRGGDGGDSTAKPGSHDAPNNPGRGSSKRAFLRGLIVTSKAKLGTRRDPIATNDNNENESGSGRRHPHAQRANISAVSETSH
jgi:hypothetical protein